MRSVRLLVVLLALLSSPTAGGANAPVPAEAAEPPAHRLDGLAFMTGCWEGPFGDSGAWMQESYSLAGAQMMLGTSQTFSDGETAFYEFSRIERREDGIVYVPYPGGEESVPFRLVVLDATRAVFENPEHDFPQRIVYHLRDDGGLLGRIEGEVDGELRFQEFPMRPVDCTRRRP